MQTYFAKNCLKFSISEIRHASPVESCVPIGGGVTEAACKALVKQRLRGSG